MDVFDVAIIGLGVAGSTLASLLKKELKVIAIDKKTSCEDSIKKPCGGLLAPDAQKALASLNINLPKEVLVDPQIFYVKTYDNASGIVKNYQRHYINMDRHKFDCWLKSMIFSSILVKNGAVCISVKKENDLYKIEYIQNNKNSVIYAKNVVGSDGANSKIRKLIAKKSPKKYLAIQEWYSAADENSFYTCIFDKSFTPNYAYTITKDKYFLLCGIFEVKNASDNFEKLKQSLHKDFSSPIKREACLVFKPSKMSEFCTGKDGIFLIGEAAGFVSPSSFEGISYAIESAVKLAETLNSNKLNKNKFYNKKTLPIKLKLLKKSVKAKIIFSPFLRKIIMKLGINSIKIVKKP